MHLKSYHYEFPFGQFEQPSILLGETAVVQVPDCAEGPRKSTKSRVIWSYNWNPTQQSKYQRWQEYSVWQHRYVSVLEKRLRRRQRAMQSKLSHERKGSPDIQSVEYAELKWQAQMAMSAWIKEQLPVSARKVAIEAESKGDTDTSGWGTCLQQPPCYGEQPSLDVAHRIAR